MGRIDLVKQQDVKHWWTSVNVTTCYSVINLYRNSMPQIVILCIEWKSSERSWGPMNEEDDTIKRLVTFIKHAVLEMN